MAVKRKGIAHAGPWARGPRLLARGWSLEDLYGATQDVRMFVFCYRRESRDGAALIVRCTVYQG
jgi:hypothetical protein